MEKKTIYISFPVEDAKTAMWISAILEVNGFLTVIPDYSQYEIEKAGATIDECDAVLILCSSNTMEVDFQSKEADHAFNARKPLISVIIDRGYLEEHLSYYFSGRPGFEIYKNRAKGMKLLIEELKRKVKDNEAGYCESKIAKLHIDLLEESDIEYIVSGNDKKRRFCISPFMRLYAKNPAVRFALKCYTAFFGWFFILLLLSTVLNGTFGSVLLFLGGSAGMFILWHLSYYASVFIAKLKIKNRFLIILMVFISLALLANIK